MSARRIVPTVFVSCLVWAVLAVSCGKGSFSFRRPPTNPTAGQSEIRRPSSSERSAWFPTTGPSELAEINTPDPLDAPESVREILPSGSSLFVRASYGAVFRATDDGANGDLRFERYPEKDAFDSPVTAMATSPDALFLSRQNGSIQAVQIPEGRIVWASEPGFVADWLLTTDPGYLVCVSADGKLSVLSSENGAVQAFLDLGVPISGNPAVTGAVLIVPKAAGISAFEVPSIKFLWTSTVPPAVGGSVWSFNGAVAFEDAEGRFRILNAVSGTERYSLTTGKRAQAASDGERLYVAGSNGRLDAYNLADGVPLWTAGSLTESEDATAGRERYSPRLAVAAGRVYIAAPGSAEAWNAETGELLDRTALSGWTDEFAVFGNRLFVRSRGGSLRWFVDATVERTGDEVEAPAGPDVEAVVKPTPEAVERIVTSLTRYSDPGTPVPSLVWRVYIPGAVRVSGYGFTVFRFEVSEAGNRVFTVRSSGAEGAFMAVYDSEGEERHVNVGELGVDRSFEQWLEPGMWYAVLGRLRGTQGTEPAFLDIR